VVHNFVTTLKLTIRCLALVSVVVLEESPWGSLRTNLQVLVLRPQVLVLGPQSPRKLSRTLHSANSPLCMITWSIKSITATVHEVMVKNGLHTYIHYVKTCKNRPRYHL